jgi:uncharacterized protein (TIGR03083 family)
MTAADDWIDALRLAHDDIAEVARSLDADGLARTSGSREWDVAQVLGHLGSQSEISLGVLLAALEHRDPPGQDANPPIWDRWNALDNEAKRAGFLEHSERLSATYEGIDPSTRESLRIDLGFLPEPVDLSTAASLRLSELTLHGWDIHEVSDPGITLLQAGTDLLVDRGWMLIGFLGHADAIDGSVTVRVETTDPERTFGLTIGDAVSLDDAPEAADAGGTLRLPAEAWLRLVAGRLAAEHTPPDVELESDAITLDDLRRVFPGY